jgi:hypothetical protein
MLVFLERERLNYSTVLLLGVEALKSAIFSRTFPGALSLNYQSHAKEWCQTMRGDGKS